MRGATSAHQASTGTHCTQRWRLEPHSRATIADRLRASRNCCAAMCASQRIQRGGMFQRTQKGEGGMMMGLIRRPLLDPFSPTPCLAGLQHRCITVSIELNDVTQMPQCCPVSIIICLYRPVSARPRPIDPNFKFQI